MKTRKTSTAVILICIALLLGATTQTFASGIKFLENKWSKVIEIAKKENKIVFVDVYASWCGPCK